MDGANGVMPVVLTGAAPPSGLADMLQQFIEQTLAASPRKARQARHLSGRAVFRSAEDLDLCVRITFASDRIELEDGGKPDAGDPSVTADFLTIAHLTSGQETPVRLLAQRKLKVRLSLLQIPFLWRMLRFMQIEPDARRTAWTRWAAPAAAVAVAAAAAYWYAVAGH